MQLHTVEPVDAPRVMAGGALSVEVFTISTLLSMPAVWTAVVERALPFDVLLERYLIVLLSIALLAELFRRLGEGGAVLAPLDGVPPSRLDDARAEAYGGEVHRADAVGGAGLADDLFGDEAHLSSPLDSPMASPLDADPGAESPLALGAPAGDDFGLSGFGDLGDEFDLAPLDLDADPFTDPA